MARTRKRISQPAQPTVDDEEQEQNDVETEEPPNPAQNDDVDMSSAALDFDTPLTWRAGRQISVGDLHKRLKELSSKLSKFGQGEVDRESVVPKAQELANAQLLNHKDNGVKAWTLLCIVQIFHLLAPDAPYKTSQLRDIFTLFYTHVIPALADSSDPYHSQHMAILSAFAVDKSVLLILDIEGSDKMVLQLFQNTFDVVAGSTKTDGRDSISNNIEYQLKLMLSTIVDEAEGLPNEVIEVILAQFLRADPSISGLNPDDSSLSAYNLARAVCNTSASRMSRYITSYFSSVLIDTLAEPEQSEESPQSKKRKHNEKSPKATKDAKAALEEAKKAHELLRELWRAAPDSVTGVIPSVEAELGAEKQWLRVMAVRTVGDMISGIGAVETERVTPLDPAAWPPQSTLAPTRTATSLAPYSFPSAHPTCYQAFLDRHRDVDTAVRTSWSKSVGRIMATNAGGKGLSNEQETELTRLLSNALRERDDDVRLASVEALSSCDFHTLTRYAGLDGGLAEETSLLSSLAHRAKDPRPLVRKAAIDLLGRIWGVASGAIAAGDETIHAAFGMLPSRILEARYLNLADVNYLVPKALHDLLLPTSFPPLKPTTDEANKVDSYKPDLVRAERILVLARDLEERAAAVFYGLQTQQKRKAKIVSHYLDSCEKTKDAKDDEAKQRLEKLIEALTQDQVEKQTATEHLKYVATAGDKRNIHLLKFCVAPESDYRKILKAIKELAKRLKDGPPAGHEVMETLMPIIQSAAPLIYNRDHVPIFMEYARSDEKGLGSTAQKLVKGIASTSSEVFQLHITELCQSLQKTQPSSSREEDSTSVDTLKACVGFARQFPDGMPKDRALYQALTSFASYGSPKAAKYATIIIATSADKKELYLGKLLANSLDDFAYGQPHFLSRLATLAQLELLANDQSEAKKDAITTIAVKEVLSQVRNTASDSDPDWSVVDDQDEDLAAKLLALKTLVNGLRGRRTDLPADEARAAFKPVADPVFKLLNTLVERAGEISKTAKTPKHHKAQLRLAAGQSLLKLSCSRLLDSFLTQIDFNRLMKLCQDPVPEVRSGFAKSLKKYLGQNKLPSRFLALVFLYAFEPMKEIKQSVETWIKSRAAMSAKREDKSDTAMEASFPRLLSLLTHHPDFSTADEDLKESAEYIIFYLKNVATEENLPILFGLAQRLKTVQDGVSTAKNEALYTISDLTETLIRAFQEEKSWTLQLSAGRPKLPPGLFRPLPEETNRQELAEKRFISEDLTDAIPDLVKAGLRTKKKAKSSKPAEQRVNRTLTDAPGKANEKKRTSTASRRKDDYEDSDEDEHRSAKRSKKAPRKAAEDAARRRSSRTATASKNYHEDDTDDDDEEKRIWNANLYSDANKENQDQEIDSTPPTSEPPVDEEMSPPKKAAKTTAKKTVTPKQVVTSKAKNQKQAPAQDSPAQLSSRRSSRRAVSTQA